MLGSGNPRQQHRDDARPEPYFGFPEKRSSTCHGHVAGEHELECTADAVTVHRCDGGLRAVPELHDEVEIRFEHLAPFISPASASRVSAMRIGSKAFSTLGRLKVSRPTASSTRSSSVP